MHKCQVAIVIMFKEIYHYATFNSRNKKRVKTCLEMLGDFQSKEILESMAEQGLSLELLREIKSAAQSELAPNVEVELLLILKSITLDCKMKDEIENIEARLGEL